MTREEEIAQIIAGHIGPGYADSFANKSAWTACQGVHPRSGQTLSINAPMQCDYDAAAKAVLEALDAREGGEVTRDQLLIKSAQAYQALGFVLLSPEVVPSDDEIERALNYFSEPEVYDENFLPWPCPPPQSEEI